ncbi:hypothetical protein [Agrobacterium rosae]|uniref:hypothetical protein n=1 Tax=Agrobacterium rosae TaxID=1972867 RepID=UPI00203370F8|nr:hypothetical protein [Agrobacterium rosae]MCM2434156.1 hypothetical protein [Agrobacterium rosae]
MAKEAKEKKSQPKAVRVRLLAQSLIDVEILALPDESEKVELRYHASIDRPEKVGENRYFFRCDFSVTKKRAGTDEDLQAVRAMYGCMFEHPSEDLTKVEMDGKKYVSTSAWNAFCSLFAIVSHQMRTPFPPLPPTPGGVDSSGRSSLEEFELTEEEVKAKTEAESGAKLET